MSKIRRVKSLAEQIAELEDPQPKDYDPEEDEYGRSDDEQGDEAESQDSDAGREHYEPVGKSKLRKPSAPTLGPKYAGRRVGRDALDDDSSDNLLSGNDEEDPESEQEPSPFGSDDDSESISANDDDKDSDSQSGQEDDDSVSDMESIQGDAPMTAVKPRDPFDTAKLRKLMNEQSKTIAATVGVKADAEKGVAVKTQRKTFDTLLNTRIRLQKGLIATNTATVQTKASSETPTEDMDSALKAAEVAALNLLNTLTDLLPQTTTAKAGTKRKHATTYTTDTSSEHIWSSLTASETSRLPIRNAILDRWSEKTRQTTTAGPRSLAGDQAIQPLSSVLASQLSDPTRLIVRTQTPRSCAPGVTALTPDIYDDADFYGLLLKELLEQRTSDSNGAAVQVDEGLSAQYRAAREAKTRRVVDTRASKGRKLRYTVHEKLQNFMAPEERGTWSERQADELFSSLLGKTSQLDEDVQVEDADDDVGGLALF
ncbi:TRAUB-domain-containing protein [Pseudovirgaria hyperparasitica]|uniref:Protein BFR2 n=1 Tax=Pseudovirgaria hyperparasitica TaxID=470096 RepID=A0A6A6WGG5_9PEZI|nr:TRAUB-domain-containing protein [Pseudovirgaria hyperparasitica]KAF2760241.1 TRAUB-domain-containing protein [Pseudovirgaria hyperparasitica]